MSNAPPAIPLLQTLMDLIGTEKKETSDESSNTNHNTYTTHTNMNSALSVPVSQPSPMSVHAIVSDWGNNGLPSIQQQETFVPNTVSLAAWQSLFSSAATPFFENETDWQSK